jgi:F0F1-type ATP synthase assembly protein I
MAKKKGSSSAWRALGLMTNIGVTMAASVAIGYYIGHYLDLWLLHQKVSWFTLFFSLCGIGAGFKGVFRLIDQTLQDGDKE